MHATCPKHILVRLIIIILYVKTTNCVAPHYDHRHATCISYNKWPSKAHVSDHCGYILYQQFPLKFNGKTNIYISYEALFSNLRSFDMKKCLRGKLFLKLFL